MYAELMRKKCSVCDETKKGSEFHTRNSSPDKLSYICKICNNKRRQLEYRSINKEVLAAQQKAWRDNNKERIALQKRKAKLGISAEDQTAMYKNQKGRCIICGIHESKCYRRLALDHDHKTGIIRELLCDTCNRALGLLKDNINVLGSAIKYLKKHQKRGIKNRRGNKKA